MALRSKLGVLLRNANHTYKYSNMVHVSKKLYCTRRQSMTDEDFNLMKSIISAPSPVGFEAAMTLGILKPHFEAFMPESWKFDMFQGNAGAVVDTDPEGSDKLTVMVMGHADKIRMHVRHIGDDGKVYVNSDSFLPLTLLGNKVACYSRRDNEQSLFNRISGTVEALGAIHFAPPKLRSGDVGVAPKDLYLELGIHGENGRKQVEDMGIRVGDPILLDRPIQRCVADNTFSGAYLDNGLGCFATSQVAKKILLEYPKALDKIRVLFAFSSHEEIGRFGSRILAATYKPDVLIAVDVSHDYVGAPIGKEQKHPPIAMGKGFSMRYGNVSSQTLNLLIEKTAEQNNIMYQRDVTGRDSGTDAMAGVLGNIDCASTSLGFPIRNMHTTSELGHTGDVQAAIDVIAACINIMATESISSSYFKTQHPRLDL
eukprot:m.245720 g.245720  ORF g.245720 m.245720 type:complete len:427 (-) comp16109_c3_seq1:102-1382(-)